MWGRVIKTHQNILHKNPIAGYQFDWGDDTKTAVEMMWLDCYSKGLQQGEGVIAPPNTRASSGRGLARNISSPAQL